MTNRCDFTEQTSVETEDGRQRPDMVVNLPGGRTIVIDCKASLDAFLDAAAAPDEDNRRCIFSGTASRFAPARANWPPRHTGISSSNRRSSS